MAKLAMIFGLILILLGVDMFVQTGSHAPTALIPAWFGIVLVVLGLAANSANSKRRMMAMHLAALVGLIGVIFAGWRGGAGLSAQMSGEILSRPGAMKEELAMAIICFIFVLLSIRSFILARRRRRSTTE